MKPILSTHRGPRPAMAWQATARPAAAIVATAGLALLALACGGPPTAGPGGARHANAAASTGPSPSAIAYSHCMRSRGVPDFPDPVSGGGIPKTSAQELKVSPSQFQAAQAACQQLLPRTGPFQQQAQQCFTAGDCPSSLVQQILTAQRKFAHCLRSHGVPDWPDPSLDTQGRPIFNLVPVGITGSATNSPSFAAKIARCERTDPAPVVMMSS